MSHRKGFFVCILFINDFEYLNRTAFYTNATSNAFRDNGSIFCLHNDPEGADFFAFSTACAELLVDHIDAVRILRNCAGFAGPCAFAALNANHRLGGIIFLYNLDTGLFEVEFFMECLGTRLDTSETGHADPVFFTDNLFMISVTQYRRKHSRRMVFRQLGKQESFPFVMLLDEAIS